MEIVFYTPMCFGKSVLGIQVWRAYYGIADSYGNPSITFF